MHRWVMIIALLGGCGSNEYKCTPQCEPPGQTSVIGGNTTLTVDGDSQADAEKNCKSQAENDSSACPAEYTVVSCVCSAG